MAKNTKPDEFIGDVTKFASNMGLQLSGEYLASGKGSHAKILWTNLKTGKVAKKPFSVNGEHHAAKQQARQLKYFFN